MNPVRGRRRLAAAALVAGLACLLAGVAGWIVVGRLAKLQLSGTFQKEMARLTLQRDELGQQVEQMGGQVRRFEEERLQLLNRMKDLLKERNEARSEAAGAARETGRWKEEAERLKQEVESSPPPQRLPEIGKLQAAYRKEEKEIRKDMEYIFSKERKKMEQRLQQKVAENQTLLSQIKALRKEMGDIFSKERKKLEQRLQQKETENQTLLSQAKSLRASSLQGERSLKEARRKTEEVAAQSSVFIEKARKERVDGLKKQALDFSMQGDRSLKEAHRKTEEVAAQSRVLFEKAQKERVELENLRSNLVQDWARLYIRVGGLEAAQGNHGKAEAAFKEAIQLQPSSAVAHYNLAVLYDDYLKDRAKAIQEYQQYLLLTPQAKDAGTVQGWVELLRAEEISQRDRGQWDRPGFQGITKTLKHAFQ